MFSLTETKMTHKTRDKSRLPETSLAGSKTSKHKQGRRKISKRNKYIDDYREPSQPQSPYKSDQYDDGDDDDDEQKVDFKGSPYNQSETNNHFLVTSKKGNTFDRTVSLNSASNSRNESQTITQMAPYINIAPFPIFNGSIDECPITHLSRFNKVCRVNNVSSIDMMIKIFAVALEKEAALWYDLNIEPYPSLTWEEIKSSFLEAFRRSDFKGDFKSELMMINQDQEEPVRSYFLRLQWVLKTWPDHEISDSLIKGIFIDGLREEFQDWVIQQKPGTLDDALRLAFTWEQVRVIRMGRKRAVKCGFCGGAHEELGCEIREKMRELWVNSMERKSSSSSVRSESGEAAEEVVNAVSGRESSVVGRHELEILGGKKKCLCGKHQCWKKNLERNSSVVSGNSTS